MLSSGVRVKDPTKPLSWVVLSDRMDFRIRVDDIETGYFLYAVLAYPDLCGQGQTVLLPVQ